MRHPTKIKLQYRPNSEELQVMEEQRNRAEASQRLVNETNKLQSIIGNYERYVAHHTTKENPTKKSLKKLSKLRGQYQEAQIKLRKLEGAE